MSKTIQQEEKPSIIEELRESHKRYGPLRKCVKTQFGIAAGATRLEAVPTWDTVYKEVKDFIDHINLELADNLSAPKPPEWWTKVLRSGAEYCVKTLKMKPEEVSAYLKAHLSISEWRVNQFLPSEYKNPVKAKAGQEGGEAKAAKKDLAETPAKKEYGSKGQSSSSKTNLKAMDTPQEVKLDVFLSKWKIPYLTQQPVIEREGEFNKDGKQKAYVSDTLLWDNIVAEVMGEGSSSDNPKRDKLFEEKGYHVVKFSNHLIELAAKDIEVAELMRRYLNVVKSAVDNGGKIE